MTEKQKKIGIGVIIGVVCLIAFYFFVNCKFKLNTSDQKFFPIA